MTSPLFQPTKIRSGPCTISRTSQVSSVGLLIKPEFWQYILWLECLEFWYGVTLKWANANVLMRNSIHQFVLVRTINNKGCIFVLAQDVFMGCMQKYKLISAEKQSNCENTSWIMHFHFLFVCGICWHAISLPQMWILYSKLWVPVGWFHSSLQWENVEIY